MKLKYVAACLKVKADAQRHVGFGEGCLAKHRLCRQRHALCQLVSPAQPKAELIVAVARQRNQVEVHQRRRNLQRHLIAELARNHKLVSVGQTIGEEMVKPISEWYRSKGHRRIPYDAYRAIESFTSRGLAQQANFSETVVGLASRRASKPHIQPRNGVV